MANLPEHQPVKRLDRSRLRRFERLHQLNPRFVRDAIKVVPASQASEILLEHPGRNLAQAMVNAVDECPARRTVAISQPFDEVLKIRSRVAGHVQWHLRPKSIHRIASVCALDKKILPFSESRCPGPQLDSPVLVEAVRGFVAEARQTPERDALGTDTPLSERFFLRSGTWPEHRADGWIKSLASHATAALVSRQPSIYESNG